eukprot:2648023-Rhodomonas_salina.4
MPSDIEPEKRADPQLESKLRAMDAEISAKVALRPAFSPSTSRLRIVAMDFSAHFLRRAPNAQRAVTWAVRSRARRTHGWLVSWPTRKRS